MAVNFLWSLVWASPLQKKLSSIQMHHLKKAETTMPRGSFGVVTKFIEESKPNRAYVGRKLTEDALSVADTKIAMLSMFPDKAIQLCSLRHSNIVQMQGVFFSDSVSYLPTIVYESVTMWTKLDSFLAASRRSEGNRIAILEQVASGLEYLHNQKPPVLHFNLTAANVFVFQKAASKLPLAKIADAGVVSLVNAGWSTLIVKSRIVDYLPDEEKSGEWTAKVDILCYGMLMAHVILQEPIVEALPLFFGEIISEMHICQLYEQLKVHPLHHIVSQCLNKKSLCRPTAMNIRQQIQSQKDDVIQWDKNIQKTFSDWVEKSETLDIMITGKTGAGKTSLINGLIGKEVGKEGYTLDRETTKVEAKKLIHEGHVAQIWDTPGLQDSTDDEDRYLEEMKKFCSDCNLYIYCVKMSQKRFEASDQRAFQVLTEAFGCGFWAKVLFVMTFANTEVGNFPLVSDKEKERRFEKIMKMWHDKITKELIKVGVEQEVAEGIEVIPTGYRMALENNPDCWILPGIPNWFVNFWYKCAKAMDERGLPTLIAFNRRRFKAPEDITKKDLQSYGIEDQPIPIQGLSDSEAVAVAGIGAALGGVIGILAGPAGVAGGALIGGMLGINPMVVALYLKYKKTKKTT